MATYWHIAHPSYDGGDLICRNNQPAAGVDIDWAWDDADEGFDGDVICLFPDTEQGRRETDWLWFERPEHILLRIDTPDGTATTTVEEGYPAIIGTIPGEWITEVRRGYEEGTIR